MPQAPNGSAHRRSKLFLALVLIALGLRFGLGAPAAAGESAGETLLRAVSGPFLALDTFQAGFEQTQHWVGMDEPAVSKGTLYLKRPNLFRIEYTEPKGHLQLSDGKTVWTYIPENGEVLKTILPEGQGGDLLRRILLESRPEAEVATAEVVGRPCKVLSLIPAEDLGLSRVRLWTPNGSNAILQYEIEDGSGNRSLFRLDHTRQNPTLKETLFEFTPPTGVPVIEVGAP
ncbi:MAG: outer membrane lipoprotein carrier protein LolA [Candidatus Eisenbacteria bacterium]|nr:outer membrane lipoprotein carrier protein LolA [Candidatus Eisenbacteria bacterium]